MNRLDPVRQIIFACLVIFISGWSDFAEAKENHIVIIAGPITGHGKHTHEYEKSAILIKHLLDRSKLQNLKTTVVFDGWPSDPSLLDSADCIVMITDGGDHKETNHPLYVDDRMATLEKQMNRGCGFVQLHWSTFNPSRFHGKITEWVGGYFDYEKGTAKNKWYSAIKHYTEPIQLGEPKHPISRGVKPFRVLEEFYYRIRFRENDPRLKKIVLSRPPGETSDFAVGWAVERTDGGRGFGFTGGHYYMNWWDPNFRKLVLNAIVWSAGSEVPAQGVTVKLPEPEKVLIVTGHNHPAHKWVETTAALIQVIENDPRILVDVTDDPEFLASDKLSAYSSIVMNYSSWDRQGLSAKAKTGFTNFLKQGGGLAIIHFANGSWTDTLPNKESDWPEYRTRIARRVWVHGQGNSGHDAFGNFRVTKTAAQHPITDGLGPFNTQDELYYRQQGPLPIEPLMSAVSRDTKKAEPMAWAYQYGKGKVFQTVLGHADVSILMAGDLIRRGTAWTTGLPNLSFDPPIARKAPYLWRSGAQWTPAKSKSNSAPKKKTVQQKDLPKQVSGKFGQALNAKAGGVFVKPFKDVRDPELTVECWVKLDSKNGFNIIAASETKSSLKHWEIYTYSGSGYFSAYFPGIFGEVKTSVDICDGQWHYVAMTYSTQFVKLYVDGKLAKEQPINFRKHPDTQEGFSIGSLVEKSIGCQGTIDEFRISRGIKTINQFPSKPFAVEKETIGLWRFDRQPVKKSFEDASPFQRSATMDWKPVRGKTAIQSGNQKPKKITGHWGEDAIGFRWTEKDSQDNRWAFTKHGRFLASTIPLPGGFAEKGLVIKVGEQNEASVCYDLKRLNMMAAWSGGFLEFNEARFGLITHLKPVGSMIFHNKSGLQWSEKNIRYHGLYQHNQRVVLEYQLGTTHVLESPWIEKSKETMATTRELQIQAHRKPFSVPIAMTGKNKHVWNLTAGKTRIVAIDLGDECLAAAVLSDQPGIEVTSAQGQLRLSIGAAEKISRCKALIWKGKKQEIQKFAALVNRANLSDFSTLTKPGRTQWPQTVTTAGAVAEQSALGYVVDTIRLPFKNPFGSLFFVAGHDWLDNGDMVVATVHGEVWLARGIDDGLEKVTWKRFATGLYQPLGIRVLKNQTYVLCRDQIVRLHDRDSNGEADFYECFHPDITTSTGVHDYVCCLETDQAGNFYYIHANDGVVRVSADGKQKKIVATGFRNPNGLGVRSDGLVTAAPQEGQWTPASAVCEVIEGRHYGYRGPKEKTPQSPLGYEKPLVFLPRLVDNSSGGQVWADSDRWGPLSNQLFHLSYGKCTMHLVMRDQVRPAEGNKGLETQGAIAPLPFSFESGVCRGRISPHDGQLYLSGLKGWTTTAVRDGCLQRVRYVGETQNQETFFPIDYKVFSNGIKLAFTQPIAPKSITSTSFSVQAWNYRYSKNYGSPEFRISNPNQQGRDQWRVNSVKLTDSGKSIFLEIPELQVADQVAVAINLRSDQSQYDGTVYATVKEQRRKPHETGPQFNGSLVEFEKKLQPGVLIKSHGWTKRTLDLFEEVDHRLEGLRIKNGIDPTRGISAVAYVKLTAAKVRFKIHTGPNTIASYRITPLDQQVALTSSLEGRVERNQQVEIPIKVDAGYCRVEYDLRATSGDLSCRWTWSSDSFGEEPIPPSALFLESGWLPSDRTGSYSSRFLEAGRLLVNHRCTQCHTLGQSANQGDKRVSPTAPDFIKLEQRLQPDYVYQKVLQPHFENHDSSMPAILDPDLPNHQKMAADLVAFLVGKDMADRPNIQPEKALKQQVEQGERLFEELGCIGCHHLPIDSPRDKYNRLSLKWTAAKFTETGLTEFLKNPHAHAPFRKMGNFSLSDPEATSLSAFIRQYSNEPLQNNLAKLSGDPKRGAKLFHEIGCANCHQQTEQTQAPKPFAVKQLDQGCLGDIPERTTAIHPRFDLKKDEKQLLTYYLSEFQSDNKFTKSSIDEALSVTPTWKQTEEIMSSLRCNTCHTTEFGNATLPEIIYDEGIIGFNPERLPNLTQIGSKLHTSWMEKLISGRLKQKSRPWLKSRMPSFGQWSTVLASGLSYQSGLAPNRPSPKPLDEKLVTIGRQLTGQNSGLDCRQCHGVGSEPPTGDDKTQIVLGINFSEVPERLRQDYYHRWMRDPLRIDPQTKMPKYSADGKSTKIKEILGGDAAKQYEALWHYLQSVEPGGDQRKASN